MDREKVYEKIRSIADLYNGERVQPRELGALLRHAGFNISDEELGEYVAGAYKFYEEAQEIADRFVDPVTGMPLAVVDHFKESLKDKETAVDTLLYGIDFFERALYTLDGILGDSAVRKGVGWTRRFLHTLKGDQGVLDVQADATAVYAHFMDVLGGYETLKSELGYVINGFIMLRNSVLEMYIRYANNLFDIFGDKIRQVAPDLFDFDSIEFLDVAQLRRESELACYTLLRECSNVMGMISHSFATHGESIMQALGDKYTSREWKALQVGFNLLDHYLDAGTQTTILRSEFEKFCGKLDADEALIVTDAQRLTAIYSTINEVASYKARAFLRRSEEVLAQGVGTLAELQLSTPALKALNVEREGLLTQYHDLEDKKVVVDSTLADCSTNIMLLDAALGNIEESYRRAKKKKPLRPSDFALGFSFGVRKKRYQMELYEWDACYGDLVREYSDTIGDRAYYRELRDSATKELEALNAERDEVKKKLRDVNARIRAKIAVNPKVQEQMAAQLREVVPMLRLAREIVNTRIDERLVRVTQTSRDVSFELSAEDSSWIDGFTDRLAELADQATRPVESSVEAQGAEEAGSAAPAPQSEQDAIIEDARTQLISRTTGLCSAYMKLKKQKEQNAVTLAEYKAELSQIQNDFKAIQEGMGEKGVALRDVVRRINLAEGRGELQEALCALSDGNIVLTDSELDAFLNTDEGEIVL